MFIEDVHTLLPEYQYSIEEVEKYFKDWVSVNGPEYTEKAVKILHGASVRERHTIAPLEVLFTPRTIEESNNLYKEKSIELGTRILQEILEKNNLSAKDIDCLITTSCTGFMIPSVNSFIANNLGMKENVRHIPITEVGCTAGATSLVYAHDYLRAYPYDRVAIINLEFPSNTIQLGDYSWDNIVGTALFADGVSCALVSNKKGPIELLDVNMTHLNDSTKILGYNLTNSGLKMNLDKSLPSNVKKHFVPFVENFISKRGLGLGDISEFLVHPGGIKILSKLEEILEGYDADVKYSRRIMESYGNLSSATLLFIINEYLKKPFEGKEKLLMLSFGPGFSAHQILAQRYC